MTGLDMTRQGYVTRRWMLFARVSGPPDADDTFCAISRLPLSLQVAFRRKMLAIFALQLALVSSVFAVFRFIQPAKEAADRFFAPPVVPITISSMIALGLLLALYLRREMFPMNWLLLVLFTGAQSIIFVGLSAIGDTNIGVFNCIFTLGYVLIMIALSGVRLRPRGSSSGSFVATKRRLLSSFTAGIIAYFTAALLACGIHAQLDRKFVADDEFGLSLLLQFVLMLWFSHDASSMYRLVSPDEYMHGVIYFYMDLFLVIVISVVTLGAAVASAPLCAFDVHCRICSNLSWNKCYETSSSDDEDGCEERLLP